MKAVRRGGFETTLRIEFSIPKLLFGNNFDEVEEPNFGEVIWKLKKSLEYMQIETPDKKVLSDAEVVTVHYSKNIILTDFSTPSYYLKEFAKVNIRTSIDTNQADFRNEGHSWKFHANDFEVTFYDKMKDLQKAKLSEKRSVEIDNSVQLGLFDSLDLKTPFEVLRMEVRYGSKRKIKEMLQKLAYKGIGTTFAELFSSQLSKNVLISTMDKLELGYPKILFSETTMEKLLSQLIIDNPHLSLRKLLAFVGARVLLDETGTRNLRQIIQKFGASSWYRLNKEMKQLVIKKSVDPFLVIRESLNTFQTVTLKNYEEHLSGHTE